MGDDGAPSNKMVDMKDAVQTAATIEVLLEKGRNKPAPTAQDLQAYKNLQAMQDHALETAWQIYRRRIEEGYI